MQEEFGTPTAYAARFAPDRAPQPSDHGVSPSLPRVPACCSSTICAGPGRSWWRGSRGWPGASAGRTVASATPPGPDSVGQSDWRPPSTCSATSSDPRRPRGRRVEAVSTMSPTVALPAGSASSARCRSASLTRLPAPGRRTPRGARRRGRARPARRSSWLRPYADGVPRRPSRGVADRAPTRAVACEAPPPPRDAPGRTAGPKRDAAALDLHVDIDQSSSPSSSPPPGADRAASGDRRAHEPPSAP